MCNVLEKPIRNGYITIRVKRMLFDTFLREVFGTAFEIEFYPSVEFVNIFQTAAGAPELV